MGWISVGSWAGRQAAGGRPSPPCSAGVLGLWGPQVPSQAYQLEPPEVELNVHLSNDPFFLSPELSNMIHDGSATATLSHTRTPRAASPNKRQPTHLERNRFQKVPLVQLENLSSF